MLGVDMAPVVRFLIGRGADVNTRSRNPLYPRNWGRLPAGHTPLMLAVVRDRPGYVQLLLEHGADPALQDEDGKTAWDYAAERPDADAAKVLLTRATGK
jgi:ankyrin repeat protein